jgi:hemolysin III
MAILLAGGIGGTIYHAFRQWQFFFYLDVVPIVLLCAVAAIYLWIRLRPKWMYIFIALAIVPIVNLVTYFFRGQRHLAIMVHYLSLAALVVTPLVMVLVRTNYRHAKWIKLALVCFGFAFLFRFLDPVLKQLPTGTHFLWHLGGAATTYCLMEYFYRIETEPLAPLPAPAVVGKGIGIGNGKVAL